LIDVVVAHQNLHRISFSLLLLWTYRGRLVCLLFARVALFAGIALFASGGNLVVGRLAIARQAQRPQSLRSGKYYKSLLLIFAHGRSCLLCAQLLYARGRGSLFVAFALGRRLGTHLSTHVSMLWGQRVMQS
jgi:hypothetical protein